MARTQTMVQLSEDLLVRLDQLAARRAISRSALIREILTGELERDRAAAAGERIAAGYRRIPQLQPDAWGDPAAFADAAAAELMTRLAAEERAQGHEPW